MSASDPVSQRGMRNVWWSFDTIWGAAALDAVGRPHREARPSLRELRSYCIDEGGVMPLSRI